LMTVQPVAGVLFNGGNDESIRDERA
jgi:hypothetical protein